MNNPKQVNGIYVKTIKTSPYIVILEVSKQVIEVDGLTLNDLDISLKRLGLDAATRLKILKVIKNQGENL